MKKIILTLIMLCGALIGITNKDYTDEMNELKEKLNNNSITVENNNTNNTVEKNNSTNNNVEKNKNNNTNNNVDNKVESNVDQNTTVHDQSLDEVVKNLPIVGIGDSVLLSAIDRLYAQFPNGYFDGKVSRSIISAKPLLRQLISNGKIGNILVLALSTNGDYSDRQNRELMEIIGNRKVYWINAVGADDPTFNNKFKEFAKNYSNIRIVDWESAAKNHPEYFYADGIHPKGNGVKAYVNTIYETIYNDYLQQQ